jgi:hypothetical protein
MDDETAAYGTLLALFLRGNLGSLFARLRKSDGYRLLFAFPDLPLCCSPSFVLCTAALASFFAVEP